MDIIRKLIHINVSLYRLFSHFNNKEVVNELIDDYLKQENEVIESVKSLEDQQELCQSFVCYDLKEEYYQEFEGLSLREKELVIERLLMSLSYYFDFEIMKGNLEISYAQTRDFAVGKRILELSKNYQNYLKTKAHISSVVYSSLKDVYKCDVAYLFSAYVSSLNELTNIKPLKHKLSDDEINVLIHEFSLYLEAAMTENNFQDFEVSCYMMLAIMKLIPVKKFGALQVEVIHLMSSEEMTVNEAFQDVINTILKPIFLAEEENEKICKTSLEKYTYEELKIYTQLLQDFKMLEEHIWKYQGNDFVIAKLLKEEDFMIGRLENPHKFASFLKDVCEENKEKSDFEWMGDNSLVALDNLWMRRIEDKAWLAAKSVGEIILPDDIQMRFYLDPQDMVEMMDSEEIQEDFLAYQNSLLSLPELIEKIKKYALNNFGDGEYYISKSDKILSLCRLHYLVMQNIEDSLLKRQIIYRYNLIQNSRFLDLDNQITEEEAKKIKFICNAYLTSMEEQIKGKKMAQSILEFYKDIYQSEILKKNRTKR